MEQCTQEHHIKRHEQILRTGAVRRGFVEFVIISAAISVTVMAFHLIRTVKAVADTTKEQNKILLQINDANRMLHDAIHEEGARMRLELGVGGKDDKAIAFPHRKPKEGDKDVR